MYVTTVHPIWKMYCAMYILYPVVTVRKALQNLWYDYSCKIKQDLELRVGRNFANGCRIDVTTHASRISTRFCEGQPFVRGKYLEQSSFLRRRRGYKKFRKQFLVCPNNIPYIYKHWECLVYHINKQDVVSINPSHVEDVLAVIPIKLLECSNFRSANFGLCSFSALFQ